MTTRALRRWWSVFKDLGFGGMLAAAWLVLVSLAAIIAPWLPVSRRQNLRNIRAAPSWSHVFGTDSRGVDMLVRVIDGSRMSLLVGLLAGVISLVLGSIIGMTAGYMRGPTDRVAVIGLDALSAFPAFAAASVASIIWGQSLRTLVLMLGVLITPVFARITRATTLPIAERDFILASRMYGAKHRRVIRRELLPNVAVPIISYGLLVVGIIIAIEGALSFFGAGLPDSAVTWGKLIAAGQERVDRSPHLALIPSGVIIATVLALNTVAERWQQRWLFGGRPPKAKAAARRRGIRLTSNSLVPGSRNSLSFEDVHTWLDTPFGDVRAVDGVDLTVAPGRLVALVGESGSGKTMLARSVLDVINAPLSSASRGRIMFGDIDLRTIDERSMATIRGRRIAMVFQDPLTSLDPVQRLGRQLTEPMRVHLDMTRGEALEHALELLRAVGIPDGRRRLRSYPHELSGGMRQRAAIAIALSCDPDILIADEPTSALDVTVQAQILDLLDELRRERGMGVLMITHDLGIVASRADEVAVMYAGRIVEHGPTSDLFRHADHPYTRALLGAIPRVDGVGHQRLASIPGTPPILIGRPPFCSFAPRCPDVHDACMAGEPTLARAEYTTVSCWNAVGIRPR